jgi:putative membrane protein
MTNRMVRGLIWIVALLHAAFSVAELFFWETLTPLVGLYEPHQAAIADPKSAALAVSLGRNTGLYNGIVAGTLIWLLTARGLGSLAARSLATYLLVSVVVAGLFGGFMILGTIPLFQSLPAAIALSVLWRTAGTTSEGGELTG